MKRLISLILICLLLFACSPKEPQPINAEKLSGYRDFVNTTAAAFLDGSENRDFSPISAYLALALAAEGAGSETQAQILALLGCADLDMLHDAAGEMLEKLSFQDGENQLTFCNSVWTAEKLSVRSTYLKHVKAFYRSETGSVPFGTADAGRKIASWINKSTSGKLAPSPETMEFSQETIAVLLSTVYFQDTWDAAFEKEDVKPGTFFTPDGERTVNYLTRFFDESSIVCGDGWMRYSLSMKHGNTMTFVLPDEGVALSDLLGRPEQLDTLLHGGEEVMAHVDFKLPKFTFSDSWDLADAFRDLGLELAFSDDADFSGMSEQPLKIDKAIQQSVIEVNEKGAKAAAFTLLSMAPTSAAPKELPLIRFWLERPFLFVLESNGHTTLFVGTVTMPDAH